MGQTVSVYEAKANLSRLLHAVEEGEEVTITRHGRPVAQLTAVPVKRPDRVPGAWRGKVWMSNDFDEFTEQDQRDWYGE